MSHYNEKARWALDYKQIAHTRRAVMPGLHMLVALRLGGGTTFPVMTLGDAVYNDSTDILAALEELRPDPPLFPDDPTERARAVEIEDELDRMVGPAIRALNYQHLLLDRPAAAAFLAHGGPPSRYRMLRPIMPTMGVATRYTHSIPPFGDRGPLNTLSHYVELLGDWTAGREFLVGDRFSVADLTACALLAPGICPDAIPGPAPYPAVSAAVREIFKAFAAEPGGAWVDRTYRAHRLGAGGLTPAAVT